MIKRTQSLLETSSSTFYITGGTLRGDAPCYVRRQADESLFESLSQGQFCYVLTSRQMGKSSLMIRTAERLRESGTGVVVLDLTAVGQNLTAEQWYDGLLNRIGRQLQLEDELESFWLANPRLGPLQRWMNAITEVVLPRYPGKLVIFIDEIDTVRSLPFTTDEFFAGIREFYNRRTTESELERLTFCLLGVASPSDLIRDTRMTPFNIGRRIELHDFTEEEAAPLAAGLGDDRSGSDLLKRVLYWTGGHPYLTQRLCQAIAEAPDVNDADGIDQLCEGLLLTRKAQEGDNNLLFVRERLLRSEVDIAGLLLLYDRVLSGKRVMDDETNPQIAALHLSGITRVENERLKARNRIYERVFDRDWVKEHMPDAELRRQQAAYRKGLMRAAAVATAIVLVIMTLAFFAYQQRNIAKAEAERADHNFKKASLSDEEARKALAHAQLQRQEALNQKTIAQQQRDLAINQEELNRRQLYAAQMNMAMQAWEDAGISTMVNYLNNHIPKPGQKDLRGFEWYYLNGLAHSELRSIRHGNTIYSVKFLSDNRRIVTASDDKVVRIWDIVTGKTLMKFVGHTGGVWSIAISPDGKTLASGSEDKTVKLWNLISGREIATLAGHAAPIRMVSFSHDGKNIASASDDKTVRIWDFTEKKEIHVLSHLGEVTAVEFSPDSKKLATTSIDGFARLWDVVSGKIIHTVMAHQIGGAFTVGFSPDGNTFITGGGDSTAKFWDTSTGTPITMPGTNTPKMIRDNPVMNISFSPSGKLLAVGYYNRLVKIYLTSTLQTLNTYKGHNISADLVMFSPNENILVSGGRDGTVKVWDVNASQGQTFNYQGGGFRAAFSPNSDSLAMGGFNPITGANILNIRTGELLNFQGKIPDTILTVAFSPDGRYLAGGGKNGNVKIWDAMTGMEIFDLQGHTGWVTSSSFSPDGKILATGSFDRTVRLWDVIRGKELSVIRGHRDIVHSLAFSPDGGHLATASSDRTVKFWDVLTKKELFTLKHSHDVISLAFSADGGKLATATNGGSAKLWDIADRKELQVFKGHVGEISQLIYSPDGKRIITGGSDGYVKFWDAATGQEVFSVKTRGQIYTLALSPNGKTLYSTPGKLWVADDNENSINSKIFKLNELTSVRTNTTPADVIPVGWTLGGNMTPSHKSGLDPRTAHNGKHGAYIKSERPLGNLQMNQIIRADAYRGKRVRLSGYLKSDNVQDSARMWMRVDAPGYASQMDTMDGRLIRATTDWIRYEIVLDIPEDSLIITFGFALRGKGQVWGDDFQLEAVEKSSPITGYHDYYDISRKAFMAKDPAERKRLEDVYRARAKDLSVTPINLGFEQEPQ